MSHPQARPPVRARHLPRQKPEHAFTLVELLAVIAIIGILCAITFGIVKGVNERAAIGQAKSELSVLAQALEGYKRQYGDYPQAGITDTGPATSTTLSTAGEYYLFNALVGKLGPKLDAYEGKSFVDLNTLNVESISTMPAATGSTPVSNSFVDPWGRRYQYFYKAKGADPWTRNPSYILLSAGPDGNTGIGVNATTGAIVVSNASYEADNLYANGRPPTS